MKPISFAESLQDTITWWRLTRASPPKNSASSNRSIQFAPPLSLFEAFRLGGDSEAQQIRHVINARHHSVRNLGLDDFGDIEATQKRGRFLGLVLSWTMYDEANSHSTQGFFDESDAPPWDFWVDVVICRNSQVPQAIHETLISWIPEEFLDVTQQGLEENCPQCFSWIKNIDSFYESFRINPNEACLEFFPDWRSRRIAKRNECF